VDNIKMDLGDIKWGGRDWIDLAYGKEKTRVLVNTVLNLQVQWGVLVNTVLNLQVQWRVLLNMVLNLWVP
jgi:hypothetical protein